MGKHGAIRNLIAFLAAVSLSGASYAGGDAEWNAGVNSLNNLKKDVRSNRSELNKAGVNANDLERRIDNAQQQLERIRREMLKNNSNFLQNSYKPISFLNPSNNLRLVPTAPIVDMGMSNAFTGSTKLVPSAPLMNVSPSGSGFMPFRSAEEVLRDNTQQVGNASGSASSYSKQPAMLAPPSAGKANNQARSSVGVVYPNVISGNNTSSSSLGVVYPSAISGTASSTSAPSPLAKPVPPLPGTSSSSQSGTPSSGKAGYAVDISNGTYSGATSQSFDSSENSSSSPLTGLGSKFYDMAKSANAGKGGADYDVCVAGGIGVSGKACLGTSGATFGLSTGLADTSRTYGWDGSSKICGGFSMEGGEVVVAGAGGAICRNTKTGEMSFQRSLSLGGGFGAKGLIEGSVTIERSVETPLKTGTEDISR